MSDLNCFIFEGHVVKNAELAYFNPESPYCTFSVACNESYKDMQGNYQNIPTYIDCVIKGKYAQMKCPEITKGRSCRVVGRLKQNKWEKDGVTYTRYIVKVKELRFYPGFNQDGNTENKQSYPQKAPQEFQMDDYSDEEPEFIPF